MNGKHINVALFVVHKGCPHTCSFCNQKSITGESGNVTPEDVKNAALTAIESLGSEKAEDGEIAFFGGSFTMIEREYMISLLDAATQFVKNGYFKGIRISTRPDGISDEICKILKEYRVSAVELGAQSLDDKVLLLNERGHTAKQVEDAMKMLKSYGFETGLQMMTGLYGSEDFDSIETAEKIIAMKPDTIRIYPTVVLENSKLCSLMRAGIFKPKGVEETVALCSKLIPMFENAGIKIIRVGLHSGGGVEENMVGGAYHPALRELCEGRIYRDKAEKILKEKNKGEYTIYVGKGCVSKMTGQKRCNLDYLENLGYRCTVKEKPCQNGSEIKYDIEIN